MGDRNMCITGHRYIIYGMYMYSLIICDMLDKIQLYMELLCMSTKGNTHSI